MTDTKTIWLRDKRTGRLEQEVYGLTPFADVPPSPFYTPSPGSFMGVRAWMDDQIVGHVTVAHDCTEGRDVSTLPWPTWQAINGGKVSPSFSCDTCGVHTSTEVLWEVTSVQPAA